MFLQYSCNDQDNFLSFYYKVEQVVVQHDRVITALTTVIPFNKTEKLCLGTKEWS